MPGSIEDIMKALPLFRSLSAAELAALVALTKPQRFAGKQPILTEGQPAPGLFVLLSGRVAVVQGGDPICDLDAGTNTSYTSMKRMAENMGDG